MSSHNVYTRAFIKAQLSRDQSAKQFAEKLLKLDEGNVIIDEEEYIKFNPICSLTDSIDDLVDRVFPNLLSNYQNKEWIWERAIMAPKNVTVNSINTKLWNALPGEALMSMLGYEIAICFLFMGAQSPLMQIQYWAIRVSRVKKQVVSA